MTWLGDEYSSPPACIRRFAPCRVFCNHMMNSRGRHGGSRQAIRRGRGNIIMKLDKSISAVITGGASGLGAATARMLAAHGVKVALFDLNEELGEKVAKELGGIFCKVNVTSSPDVDAGFAKARATNGQERILVNCAGIGGAAKTVSRDKESRAVKEYPLEN